LVFIAFSLVPCAGYASTLNFENYKVSEIYSGEHYQLTSNEQSDEKWMTERKNAMEGPVNLAGNYVVYTVGCGGGTVCGEILNVKTGEVVGSFLMLTTLMARAALRRLHSYPKQTVDY
jgi:hypothetical protein